MVLMVQMVDIHKCAATTVKLSRLDYCNTVPTCTCDHYWLVDVCALCRRHVFQTANMKTNHFHAASLSTLIYLFLRRSNQVTCQQISKNAFVKNHVLLISLYVCYIYI